MPPIDVKALTERAHELAVARRLHEAADVFRQLSELSPNDPVPRGNYGIILARAGEYERALPILERSSKELPNAETFSNLGFAYRLMHRFDDAFRAFGRAIELEPNHAQARLYRSFTLLLLGNFRDGWKEFDWRLRLNDYKLHAFAGQSWDGSMDALKGKTILLSAEQGFGDTIQFARFIPILARAGAKVILACQASLRTLLSQMEGVSEIWSAERPQPVDLFAPLMSLGRLLNVDLQTILASVPIIPVKPGNRLADVKGKKVGLFWAGSPTPNPDRTIPLRELSPLAAIPGISLISLQRGEAADEIRNVSFGSQILDLGNTTVDFADTASLMAELDLFITIDTSVCHLAGTIGIPVWTLLPYSVDWRWLLGRDDCPWYPTMKLFRQARLRDWKPVVEKIAKFI
jgi:hypothetical protein